MAPELVSAIMTLIGAFLLMGMLNWELTLLTFLVIPLIVWVAMYFSGKMTKTYRQLFGNAQFNTHVEDTVGSITSSRHLPIEEPERLFVDNSNYRATKLLAYKILARSLSISYMLMRFVSLFVIICGTWFVIHGELSYGEFVALFLLTNFFFQPFEDQFHN